MPEVYNWQLGRMATYVYEEKHPKEQFTFVFNTNRCIACQTCTMAHKSTWTFSKGCPAPAAYSRHPFPQSLLSASFQNDF